MSTRLVPTCSWLPATADDLQPPSTADHAKRKHCISLSVSSRIMLGLCAQALPESVQSKSIPFHIPVVLGHYPENKSSLSVVILWSKPSLVHWNFRSVIDGFPTSSSLSPVLSHLSAFMGKTGCPPRTMLPMKTSLVTHSLLMELRGRK